MCSPIRFDGHPSSLRIEMEDSRSRNLMFIPAFQLMSHDWVSMKKETC